MRILGLKVTLLVNFLHLKTSQISIFFTKDGVDYKM